VKKEQAGARCGGDRLHLTFCPAQLASSSTAKYISDPPPLVTNVAQRMRPREGAVVVTVVVAVVVGVVVVVDVGVLVAVDVAVVVGVVVGVVHWHVPDREPSSNASTAADSVLAYLES